MDGVPRRLLALAILAALVAACDGTDPTPAMPSSAFAPSASDPGGGSIPTGSPPPTTTGASPVPDVGGDLREGTLDLRIEGDVELSGSLTRLISGVASRPPGGFAVVWSSDGADATSVGIGGAAFLGTRPTSPTLVLSVTAQTPEGLTTWVSTGGECDVTLDAAGRDRFAGRFSCSELASATGEVATLSATFEATR